MLFEVEGVGVVDVYDVFVGSDSCVGGRFVVLLDEESMKKEQYGIIL